MCSKQQCLTAVERKAKDYADARRSLRQAENEQARKAAERDLFLAQCAVLRAVVVLGELAT